MHRFGPTALVELQDTHSFDRLRSYVATAGTLSDGFELYIWNTVVASRFHGSLQAIEVGLRNAWHRELSAYLGPTWYDDPSFKALDSVLNGYVKTAKGHGPTQIIPSLPFYFWTRLFNPAYPAWLWSAVSSKVFTPLAPASPTLIQSELDAVRDLRNRVAHLEPLHTRNLVDDHDRIERIASWIHPTLESWIKMYDAAMSAILSRPVPGVTPPRGSPPWPLHTF
jgi:hypothetical protein